MPTYTFSFPPSASGKLFTIRDDAGVTVDTITAGASSGTVSSVVSAGSQGPVVVTSILDVGEYAGEATDPRLFYSARATGVLDVPASLQALPDTYGSVDRGQTLAGKYRLRSGNTAIGLVGDSTGNNGDEWFEGLVVMLGKNDPALRVEMNRWNSTTNTYDAVAVLQAGTDGRVLSVYNGSISGSVLATQIPYVATMFPVALDFLIVSAGHNYAAQTVAQFHAAIDAFLTAFRAVRPEAGVVISSQNPRKSPAANNAEHLTRNASLRGYANLKRYGYVPVTETFLARSDWQTLIQSDGIHPTLGITTFTGSSVWRDVALAYLNTLGAEATVYGAPPFGPGQWIYTASPTSTGSAGSAQGVIRLVPWKVENPMWIRGLAAEVTVVGEAGSKVRLGIYADNGGTSPGALVAGTGALAGDAVAMVSEEFTEVRLSPGLYWVGAVAQLCPTTVPTLRGVGAGWNPPILMTAGSSVPVANSQAMGMQASGVTGALPATLAASGQTTYAARVLVKAGL